MLKTYVVVSPGDKIPSLRHWSLISFMLATHGHTNLTWAFCRKSSSFLLGPEFSVPQFHHNFDPHWCYFDTILLYSGIYNVPLSSLHIHCLHPPSDIHLCYWPPLPHVIYGIGNVLHPHLLMATLHLCYLLGHNR